MSSTDDGDAWRHRYFAAVDDAFLAALHQSLPDASRHALAVGYRYCRLLFEAAVLHRCISTWDAGPGYRAQDIGGLIAFLGAGLRNLAGPSANVIAIGAGAHPSSVR
jgi:hypothetical protein